MSNHASIDPLYALKLGDLGPPLVVQLLTSSNGANVMPFVLQAGDAVTLRYLDPNGAEHTVSMTFVPGQSTASYSWQSGDLPLASTKVYQGEVHHQRAGQDSPQTFPDAGVITWRVNEPIGDVEPPTVSYVNDNAATIPQLAPVYQTSQGHCDLAASDTQAHATCVGLAYAAIASGASGPIISSGPVIAPTSAWDAVTGQTGGLTLDAAYYVDPTTPGQLTSTLPTKNTWAALVGIAESSTMLALGIQAAVGPLAKSGSKLPIVAIKGQSNAVGNAQLSTLSAGNFAVYARPFMSVQLTQQMRGQISDSAWGNLPAGPVAAREPKLFTSTFGNFGLELSFAQTLYAAGVKHAIAKDAIGSTSLWVDHSPWSDAAPSTGLVTNTTSNFFRQGVQFDRAQELALNGYLAGIVWVQGEQDATNATAAANYQANLTAWATEVRKTWPLIPIVVVRLSSLGSGAYQSTVSAAQSAFVAATANTAIVNTDDIPLQVDGLHYTADGYVTLGQRCAAALLTLDLLAQPADRAPWSVDGQSGKPTPYGAWEWSNLLNAAGLSPLATYPQPAFHHACQDVLTPTTFEATSNLMQDSIGGWNLVGPNGSPPVQQAIAGWAAKGIGFTGGSTSEQWQSASGLGYDMSAGSVLQLVRLLIPSSPSAERSIWAMTTAAGKIVQVDLTAAGLLRIFSNAVWTNSINSHVRSTPLWIALRYNKTAGTMAMLSSLENLTLPYLAQTVDGAKGFGAFSGFQAHNAIVIKDHLAFTGAAAELSNAQVKTLLQTLGETISWS